MIQKGRFIKSLEPKLNATEIKKLRDLILVEKPTSTKSRFKQMLIGLHGLLPTSINDDFVDKIVNTRNNITHPKGTKEADSFTLTEYDDAAYLLTKVIRAYFLKYISIDDDIIKKIIRF